MMLRYGLLAALLLGFAVAALYAGFRVDDFLATDSRFLFAGPPASGEPSPSLRIEGVVHASPEDVARAFAGDFGRSIYLLPVAERRRNLLAVGWVRDAVLSRQWPDSLVVRITERTPVAFVQLALAGGQSHRMALIDEDGVILEPPRRARFDLPVVTGIRADHPEDGRRERIRQALRLFREAGSLAGEISEINVSDPENVKATLPLEGNAVVLWMGNRNFLPRLQNFLAHFPDIHKRRPGAAAFDLRLDDRITAVEDSIPHASATGLSTPATEPRASASGRPPGPPPSLPEVNPIG
jgi:cell division protein FtsQ